MLNEAKYNIIEAQNKQTRQLIPSDEPVFLFRAQDKLTRRVLCDYADLLPEGSHKEQVLIQIGKFIGFAETYSYRMKDPD